MNTSIKVALIIGLSILISVFMILRNQKEERIVELEKLVVKENKLDKCFSNAIENYALYWNNSCSSRGLGDKCKLPEKQAWELNDKLETDNQNCVELYK